jgi:hypothetical protein
MRIITALADRMLSALVPSTTADALSCQEVFCGCINGHPAFKLVCPGFTTPCQPGSGTC